MSLSREQIEKMVYYAFEGREPGGQASQQRGIKVDKEEIDRKLETEFKAVRSRGIEKDITEQKAKGLLIRALLEPPNPGYEGGLVYQWLKAKLEDKIQKKELKTNDECYDWTMARYKEFINHIMAVSTNEKTVPKIAEVDVDILAIIKEIFANDAYRKNPENAGGDEGGLEEAEGVGSMFGGGDVKKVVVNLPAFVKTLKGVSDKKPKGLFGALAGKTPYSELVTLLSEVDNLSTKDLKVDINRKQYSESIQKFRLKFVEYTSKKIFPEPYEYAFRLQLNQHLQNLENLKKRIAQSQQRWGSHPKSPTQSPKAVGSEEADRDKKDKDEDLEWHDMPEDIISSSDKSSHVSSSPSITSSPSEGSSEGEQSVGVEAEAGGAEAKAGEEDVSGAGAEAGVEKAGAAEAEQGVSPPSHVQTGITKNSR